MGLIGSQGVKKSTSPYLAHRHSKVLDRLEKGEIENVRVSHKLPVDQIAAFGLTEGFLQTGPRKFPDLGQT